MSKEPTRYIGLQLTEWSIRRNYYQVVTLGSRLLGLKVGRCLIKSVQIPNNVNLETYLIRKLVLVGGSLLSHCLIKLVFQIDPIWNYSIIVQNLEFLILGVKKLGTIL